MLVKELIFHRIGQRMACKADPLLPVTSAVQTTTFCPGAALPVAATYSLMSTATAGTSLGHYTLLLTPCVQATLLARGKDSSGQKELCKSGSQLPVPRRTLALGYSWQEHGEKCWTEQYWACHCASAMVLPCMEREEVPQVPCLHKRLPPLLRAAQDLCWRIGAAGRESSLTRGPGNSLLTYLICLVSPSGHPCHWRPVLHVSGRTASQDDGRWQNPHCWAHHQPYSCPAGSSQCSSCRSSRSRGCNTSCLNTSSLPGELSTEILLPIHPAMHAQCGGKA